MIQSKLLNIILLPDENFETFRWIFSINKQGYELHDLCYDPYYV